MPLVFTSCTFGYLDRARVLAKTLKSQHPDWEFVLVMIDVEPDNFEFHIDSEPFDTVYRIEDMGLAGFEAWMFGHDVVELCTAVKGPFLKKFTEMGYDKIIYLDPDIAIYNSLDPIIDLLENYSIIITPHQVTPEVDTIGIMDNEIAALNYGVYNLGFLAIRNDPIGRKLANWWNDRLLKYCHDDLPRGLFVDQKWFNLVPSIFDSVHILRDPGYNVASWNLSHRLLTIRNKRIYVNDVYPLRFYHFTKLGPIGHTMTKRYAKDNHEVFEVWAQYERMVKNNAAINLPKKWWFYGMYEDQTPIEKIERVLYRTNHELHEAYPRPFSQKVELRNEIGFSEKNNTGTLLEKERSPRKKPKGLNRFVEKNTRGLRRFVEKNTRSLRRFLKKRRSWHK